MAHPSRVQGDGLRLRLLVSDGSGTARDLLVEVGATHTVADLTAALSAHLGCDGHVLQRLGDRAPLQTEIAVGDSGLRVGDRLSVLAQVLSAAGGGAPSPRTRLVVVSGPDAGRDLPLVAGDHVVGRSGRADLTVADPYLSREHMRVQVGADLVGVADAGSVNSTFVDGRPVGAAAVALAPGADLTAGASLWRLLVEHAPTGRLPSRDGALPFNRPPRITPPAREPTVELPAPPEPPPRARLPMSAAVAPLLVGLALAIAMDNASMLAFALLSPVMAVWSYVEDRRGGRKQATEAAERFERRVREAESALATGLEDDRQGQWRAHPGPATLLERAQALRSDLWERRPSDADHLELRVGWGTVPSGLKIEIAHGGSDDARTELTKRFEPFGTIPRAPLTVSLRESGTIGMAGDDPGLVEGLARWLVAQVAGLHSPLDVTIAVVVPPDQREEWAWTTWLPHTSSPVIEGPLVVGTAPEATDLFARLGALAQLRADARSGLKPRSVQDEPAIVVAVHAAAAIDAAVLAEMLASGPASGIHVVWFGGATHELPGQVGALVEVTGDEGHVTVTDPRSARRREGEGVDGLSPDLALELALMLAPIRDVTARDAAGNVPRSVSLLELIDLQLPHGNAMAERWRTRNPTIDATLGATAAGRFHVDLRRDGPHALVGGTTGAGKSELLQSLVAALAANHPPDRLTFLLVDYKGGAAFKDCVALPHVVGSVTDLDGRLVDRALVSLNAELKRREHVLARADAKDLLELERRSPELAPPSMLIVIDEFATLVKELPAFVDGVVDVAQRGRSLGIHLVLATQRPAGAINDNIRSNTNVRIAMRMNDEADSEDVIASAVAARIPRDLPGRAYARMGHSELTEFQAAYVGGTYEEGEGEDRIEVHDLEFGRPIGKRHITSIVVHQQLQLETDLERLVGACRDAVEVLGIAAPPSPWLPPLPPILSLQDLPAAGEEADRILLGMLDLPDQQEQRPWALDLERDGSLLIYGASGSGKTTLLRTVAASIAATNTPEDFHVYGLDFGARGLGMLEALPHVGSVVPGDDLERIMRLFDLLAGTVQERKRTIGRSGSATLGAHRAVTGERIPRVVVLLDGYAGFASTFERIDHGHLLELLPRLVADGRPVGLHFVITAQRRGDVPTAVAGSIASKLALSLSDPDDYLMLGVDATVARTLVLEPGQGLLDARHETRVAVVGGDPDAAAQNAAIEALGASLPAAPATPPVALLPEVVPDTAVAAPASPHQPILGLREADLGPVALDLRDGHVLIAGPPRSGRSTALATLALGLAAAEPRPVLRLLAPRRSPLSDLDVWDAAASGSAACEEAAYELVELIDGRDRDDPTVVIVVDDADELAGGSTDFTLEQVARRGRDLDVVVIAATEATAAHRAYGGLVGEVRRARQGLLLAPDLDVDGDLMGVRLPRRATVSFPAGRGYLVRRGQVELVQAASLRAPPPLEPTMSAEGAVRAQRVVRTFLFSDIVRSTSLVEAIGDDAWVSLVRWHDETLQRAFAEHGGDVVDQAGDGFFVAFREPRSAVDCAVAIQDRLARHRVEHGFAPEVRIGVHRTEASFDGRYRGQGVHVAARIAAVAGGGEVLASMATAEVAGVTPVGAPWMVQLAGVTQPVDVVRLTGEVTPR